MSAWSDHHPLPVRPPRHLIAGVAATGLTIVVVLEWRWILVGLLLWTVGRHAFRRAFGLKPRPRSSWSSLLRSGAIAYAAWNSRWLKPTTPIRARVPEKGQPTEEDLNENEEAPY